MPKDEVVERVALKDVELEARRIQEAVWSDTGSGAMEATMKIATELCIARAAIEAYEASRIGDEVTWAEARKMWTLAAATLERDVLLHGLTLDEQDVMIGAVLNAAMRSAAPREATEKDRSV